MSLSIESARERPTLCTDNVSSWCEDLRGVGAETWFACKECKRLAGAPWLVLQGFCGMTWKLSRDGGGSGFLALY